MVVLGLDGAGKTTLLYQLKLGEVVTTIPTVGFNVETITHKNFHMTIWDIGGQDKIRCLWKHYYQNTRGVIFVVDSSDRDRFPEAKEEIQLLIREESLQESILLVLANKQDLDGAIKPGELVNELGLCDVKNMKWEVRGVCGRKGEGVYDSLDWLVEAMRGRN